MWPMAPRSPWDIPTPCHLGNPAGSTPMLMFIQSDILMGGAAVINSKSHVMCLRISTTGGLLSILIGNNTHTYQEPVSFILSFILHSYTEDSWQFLSICHPYKWNIMDVMFIILVFFKSRSCLVCSCMYMMMYMLSCTY